MPELDEETLRFLAMMVPMNIEARYPQQKQEVGATLNKDICEHILEQTKRIHLWILQKL